MADKNDAQELDARELQTLLLMGQAMSQEQDQERICTWVADATVSLLGASLVSIIQTPTEHSGPRPGYGKVGGAPISASLARDLAKLTTMEWPSGQQPGRVSMLPAADLPPGLTNQGIDHLARVHVRTIRQEYATLLVGMARPWEPSPREQFLLTTLANQAALALENARLRRETMEQAERLAAFNRMIKAITSIPDLEGFLGLLSSEVQHLLPHDRASVALANPGGQTATIYATVGRGAILGAGTVIPIAGSMVGQVIETGQGCFNTDLAQLEAVFLEVPGLLALGIRSNVTVPLWDGADCLGSLNLGSFQVGRYGAEELALAQEIADQVAVGIIHAQNHQALQESEEQVRLLLNSTGEAIYGVDLQGNCTFCNPACLRLLGYDEVGDLCGENMHTLIHHTLPNGQPYPQTECRIYQAIREESGTHVDDELLWRADGTSFPAEYWSHPVRRENEVVGCVVTFVDISERKQAEQTLLQQMRELAVLEERSRIAREIHDTLAQGITAIIWQLNAADRVVDSGGEPARQSLARVRDLARESLQEARRSVWDLRAGPLEGRTLAQALRQEAETASNGRDIQASFVVSGDARVLPSGIEAALLRICQESLTNALKHASPTQVTVTLTFEKSQVQLTIQDNGVGFDPEAPRARGQDTGGFGLINMQERVRILGGEFAVQSAPGRGTMVEATLSLE